VALKYGRAHRHMKLKSKQPIRKFVLRESAVCYASLTLFGEGDFFFGLRGEVLKLFRAGKRGSHVQVVFFIYLIFFKDILISFT